MQDAEFLGMPRHLAERHFAERHSTMHTKVIPLWLVHKCLDFLVLHTGCLSKWANKAKFVCAASETVYTSLIFSQHMNEPDKLHCYITLGQKGLPGFSLLGPFGSYKENQVLRIRLQLTTVFHQESSNTSCYQQTPGLLIHYVFKRWLVQPGVILLNVVAPQFVHLHLHHL